mgnify:CR=1 FL=1
MKLGAVVGEIMQKNIKFHASRYILMVNRKKLSVFHLATDTSRALLDLGQMVGYMFQSALHAMYAVKQ